jgi:hypothetical protein
MTISTFEMALTLVQVTPRPFCLSLAALRALANAYGARKGDCRQISVYLTVPQAMSECLQQHSLDRRLERRQALGSHDPLGSCGWLAVTGYLKNSHCSQVL